jgi:hypothetical protein
MHSPCLKENAFSLLQALRLHSPECILLLQALRECILLVAGVAQLSAKGLDTLVAPWPAS